LGAQKDAPTAELAVVTSLSLTTGGEYGHNV
jgi:hypothetical protein